MVGTLPAFYTRVYSLRYGEALWRSTTTEASVRSGGKSARTTTTSPGRTDGDPALNAASMSDLEGFNQSNPSLGNSSHVVRSPTNESTPTRALRMTYQWGVSGPSAAPSA